MLHRAGVPYDERLVRLGDSLVGGGWTHGLDLLRSADPPTAIISGSDEQAYGLYKAAREVGLRIPDDLSVVGFDDVDLCEWVSPQLTTVRQPLIEMAREATRMVLISAASLALAEARGAGDVGDRTGVHRRATALTPPAGVGTWPLSPASASSSVAV